jgi:dTDP-4-dehydrorhamnose reductase
MNSNTNAPILITGGTGMLGRALGEALKKSGRAAISLGSRDCDITSPQAVQRVLEHHRPRVLINCAAYTKVDLAEKEQSLADAVNGQGVATLARACGKYDVKLVHISTDFVFDGRARRPYRIDDPVGPLSAYGKSKLLGEKLLQEINPPGWIIARTAWLYGPGGACFPKTMVDRARAQKPLKVVADQAGSPTYTPDLAEALLVLLEHDATGLWHLTNSGQTTWYEFARATLEAHGLPATPPALEKTTSDEWRHNYPESAIRPAYSVLDIGPFHRLTGRAIRPWEQALKDFRSAWGGAS